MSTLWNDYLTAALIGSEKSAAPNLPPELAEAAQLPDDAAKPTRFLTSAGALALWRRVGWRPPITTISIEVADAETLPAISRASAGHLREMLGGRFPLLLAEWLREVVRLQRRLPAEILPAVLEYARTHASFRPLVATAGGARAAWLARHNPQWSFSSSVAEDDWETGSREQRLAVLRGLRLGDPAAGRAKLESTWKTEPAELRAAFLAELLSGLSVDDEAFLESALDDRSKEVRRVAIDLLARLPQSKLVARMIERAQPLLAFTPGKLLSRARLTVSLPPDADAPATRDGVDPKVFGPQKTLGAKAVMLVQIVAAIPLTHWQTAFDQAPVDLLKAVEKDEFARALATGWAWAALRQRDIEWAEALLDSEVAHHDEFLPAESLVALLPEEKRAARLVHRLHNGALDRGEHPAWFALGNQFGTFSNYLPPVLGNALMAKVRRLATGGFPAYFTSTLEEHLARISPQLLATSLQGWPMDQHGVPSLVEFLNFRHNILQALTAS